MRVAVAPFAAIALLQSPLRTAPLAAIKMAADDLVLSGTAESSVVVPRIEEAPSLSDFLLSGDSDEILLGTSEFKKLDDVWQCKQAPVEWFSVMLTPIFNEVIERSPSSSRVDVRVLNARVEIDKGGKRSALVANAMGQVMSRASITGLNAVRWSETSAGWSLTGDITLSVGVSPPRFFVVPRDLFEKVGSSIIRSTCKQRGDAFLDQLAKGYAEWARSKQGK